MPSLKKGIAVILKRCLKLKKGEKFLVVYDNSKKKLSERVVKEAKRITEKVEKAEMRGVRVSGNEPNKVVAEKMLWADVIIIVTKNSITHTDATRKAWKKGARIASMPGITEDIIKRCMDIDYSLLKDRCRRLEKVLLRAKKVRIETKENKKEGRKYFFEAFIGGRKINKDLGKLWKKSTLGNLPCGEIAVAPIEGTSDGVIVVDGSIAQIGLIKKPIKIKIRKGYAYYIKGGKEAGKLRKILKLSGENSRNIAEIGIGLNEKARIGGNVLEDEKVLGTCHIALGNSISLGGKVRAKCHIDLVIRKPKVYIDERLIIKNGRLLL